MLDKLVHFTVFDLIQENTTFGIISLIFKPTSFCEENKYFFSLSLNQYFFWGSCNHWVVMNFKIVLNMLIFKPISFCEENNLSINTFSGVLAITELSWTSKLCWTCLLVVCCKTQQNYPSEAFQRSSVDWFQSPVTKYFFLIILFDSPLN